MQDLAVVDPHLTEAQPSEWQAPDDHAFRSLVQTHQQRLLGFIERRIGRHSDAEELTQQAFVEAARSLAAYRGEAALSTWLYGIAMNLVRNYLSRAPHRRFAFEDDTALDSVACASAGPQHRLEQTQLVRQLERELAELPAEMRDVLMLVGVEELAYEEAAVLLNVPIGTVRSRVSRGRAALRTRFRAQGIEQPF